MTSEKDQDVLNRAAKKKKKTPATVDTSRSISVVSTINIT